MAFQTGSLSLSNGQVDAEVTFPVAFTVQPAVVLACVVNYSNDSPKLFIELQATDKSSAGFSVHLYTAPDTDNYALEWAAGSMETIFQALKAVGKTLLHFPVQTSRPSGSSRVPVVSMYPLPTSKVVLWSDLETWFAGLKATPPSSPSDDGQFGMLAVDESYFYFHDGATWTRAPRDPSADWSNDVAILPTREGVADLESGETLQTIVFPVEFASGDPPAVRCSIQNLAAGDKLVLGGIVIDSSLTGFTLALSAEPDSDDYQVVYEAKQYT